MKANEIMTETVFSINEDQSLGDAAKLMWEHDCGWLPVLAQDGTVLAAITDRDITMSAYFNGGRLFDIPVSNAQSSSVVTCGETDDINDVESIMQAHQVRRLPVVDEQDKLLGVISLNDIAVAYKSRKNGISAKGLSDTLAAVCSHKHSSTSMVAVA